ncbi:MAG: D-alanine--D-alanine ligase family protein [Aminivibrio sp.]|jgi:D-alanine-D-alanine ligase
MNDEFSSEPEVPLLCASRISVVYNLKKIPERGEPDDKYEEYDPLSTVEAVADAIAAYGFGVSLCEQDDGFHRRILDQAPDLVANIAEGRGNGRAREAQVPCFLESMSIPFWGSDGLSMAVALDKLLTSRTLGSEGIPVPFSRSFREAGELSALPALFDLHSRYIVKPRYEGSSKGVFSDSVADSPKEAEEKIRRIWRRYGQPALVEEYLPGEEITVGVTGNGHPSVAGMMRISPVKAGEVFLYSLEEKRNYLEKIRYDGPETIPPALRDQLGRLALAAFRILELRDMARLDFRLDGDGIPRIIDVNPLPGLSPLYSDLPILHRLSGGDYRSLIGTILGSALRRYGMTFQTVPAGRTAS